MSVVWSCNEWDQLEEVIVGNPLRARFPTADSSTQLTEYPDRPLDKIPQGPFPQWIIDETEEDLNAFVTVLKEAGVTVKRPETWPHEAKFSTIHWESEGYYNYCPRDIMLVIGDQIIETPNVMRSRAQESFSYRKLDLLYLVSGTGNELGGQWLQTILGDDFRVHFLKDVYYGSHIDSTFVALRPGLVLCSPARINENTLPEIFKQWEVIYSPPMENTNAFDADYLFKSIGSKWIDMNLFSINPNLVVVDRDQTALIKLLEKKGLDVIPHKLRHSKMLGGGYHCITLDIRRKGTMQRYFD